MMVIVHTLHRQGEQEQLQGGGRVSEGKSVGYMQHYHCIIS